MDLLVRSRRMVLPEGVKAASLLAREGRIAAVGEHDAVVAGARVIDAGDDAVLPGLVDTHVHVNQPGRTEWEGYRTATEAAAAGGITAIVDMPLNSIPVTTTLQALRKKQAALRSEKIFCDVAFWGGVVPGNAGELAPMIEAGVMGFKCFLVDSGIAEFGWVSEGALRPAMREVARISSTLLVHAELAGPLRESQGDPRAYRTYLESRPRAAENEAVALMARLCRETRARTHIVHHSSADALETVRGARREGLPFSSETCPHYLFFAAEEIPDGRTEFKCAPPIRERENREALWGALADGTLSMVVSDHSPCSPALKKLEHGRFDEAWGGISGLQLSLSVTFTEAVKRGHGLREIARWMSEAPARLAGLTRKGALRPGFDADFVILDTEAAFTVDPALLRHKHKLTPYAGRELRGRVKQVFVHGHDALQAPHGEERS
ncbi:MAG TPA: allantoinase AllB [Myxococcales bacterium]